MRSMSGREISLSDPPVRRATVLGWIAVGVFALASGVFYLFPQIDLAASRLFVDASGVFPLEHDPWLFVLNRSITWASRAFALALLLGVLAAFLPWTARASRLAWLARERRAVLFLFVALALGPGLLVNSFLKEHSGRARPSMITEFGGSKHFTRAFVFSDQCDHNCAFVSGHAAVAAFPVAGFFIARRRRTRVLWLAGGLAFGVTIGLARILTGSHFLSDIVI